MDDERAHDLGVRALTLAGRSPNIARALIDSRLRHPHPLLRRTVLGLSFANPLGVAAGLDKQGSAIDGLFALGFGWVEVGTVTPRPQAGNNKPRMFRLQEHNALINRMGFNSIGVEAFIRNIRTQKAIQDKSRIVAINLGKNADTPLAEASSDYIKGINAIYEFADLISINISSPNTPELRKLQFGDGLAQLLDALSNRREQLGSMVGRRAPLMIKIAPDGMSEEVLTDIVEQSLKCGIDGIIAGNTSVGRTLVEDSPLAEQAGGLSGAPITGLAQATLRQLAQIAQGRLTLTGCGGIQSGDSAVDRLDGGADLIQLYTGLVFHGPSLVADILAELTKRQELRP